MSDKDSSAVSASLDRRHSLAQHKRISSPVASFPPTPAERNVVKHWDVTRYLMDCDFSRHHLVYWCLSGVRTIRVHAYLGLYGAMPGESTQSLQFILFRPETQCVLVLRTHPVGTVVLSPSMRAYMMADDEYLAHVLLLICRFLLHNQLTLNSFFHLLIMYHLLRK